MTAARSDSSARAIAAKLAGAEARTAAATSGRRMSTIARIAERAGRSTAVGHYTIPRTARRPDVDVASDGKAITAAAQIVSGDAVVNKQTALPKQAWQKESWELRDEVGEFRFSGDRFARAVSLCRLYVAKVDGAEGAAGTPPAATAEDLGGDPYLLGRDLFGTKAQMQQSMKRAAQHLIFNGESLLVVSYTEEDGYSWAPYSTSELTKSGTGWKLSDGIDDRELGADELVIRAWNPHPEKAGFADSAARAVLPVVRELKGLTQHVGAQIDSRLAGAGVLWVPDTIEVLGGQAAVELVEDPEDPNGPMIPAVPVGGTASAHPFVDALSEYMTIPIKDRGSAAAIVPLVVKVPTEALAGIQHTLFGGNLDDKATALRDEAIRRLALGMDSAPEVLLGLGSANHWSAWQVTEEEVTLNVGPGASTICHALTAMWLRPALEQIGYSPDEAAEYQIWFDASALKLRPDRSSDAQALFDKGVLSKETLLRENGFDENDLPAAEEEERALLIGLLKGAPSGEMARLLLPLLGITIPDQVLDQAAEIGDALGGPGSPSEAGSAVEGGEAPTADRSLPERSTEPPQADEGRSGL